MANKILWKQALKRDNKIHKYLPHTEKNWPIRLNIEQIAKILIPDSDNAQKDFIEEMYELAINGGIEFDAVEVEHPTYRLDKHYKRSVDSQGMDSHTREEIDYKKSLSTFHSSDDVINALKHIKVGGTINLKQYCNCDCNCTLIDSYHNGLPKRWLIEGVHENPYNIPIFRNEDIKLPCNAIPLMTAKQCHDFLYSDSCQYIINSLRLSIDLNQSILSGWWEDLKLGENNDFNIDDNTKLNNKILALLDGYSGVYKEKSEYYIEWLKIKIPDICDFESLTEPYMFMLTKADIAQELITFTKKNGLWLSGFDDWWYIRPYKDKIKVKSGRRPQKR